MLRTTYLEHSPDIIKEKTFFGKPKSLLTIGIHLIRNAVFVITEN